MIPTDSKFSHDDLAHNLAEHLKSDGRMIWENIVAGKSGSVRPDVLTIEKNVSKPNPISYEVKVSVPDFRADITSGKWMNYLEFSSGVVFATPKGLISRNDVPVGCGLIQFNGQFWNTLKKPTLQTTVLDGQLLLKLLIHEMRKKDCHAVLPVRLFDEVKHNEALRAKFGKDLSKKLSLIDDYPEILQLKNQLCALLGVHVDRWCYLDEIAYQIEKLKKSNDDIASKESVCEQLRLLQQKVDSNFNKLINKFTSQ